MRIGSDKALSYPGLTPSRAKAKGTGLLEGNSEPRVLSRFPI